MRYFSREEVAEMRLRANMTDDYNIWRCEMRAIDEIEIAMGYKEITKDEATVTPQPRPYVPQKGHVRANNTQHALELMNQFFKGHPTMTKES